jgi:glycosyltransferase involved in cell wall biosynthesis
MQNAVMSDQTSAPHDSAAGPVELSIVMPCLNEAQTVGTCIRKARGFLESRGVPGEVIIADNGSTDGSQEIATGLGARVVQVTEKGYGSALMGGIAEARGRYIIMGDSDDSYDFSDLGLFLEKLRQGYDLVMGNRFKGGIKPGAMPSLHRYLGNPVLSFIGYLFFKTPVRDFHCGLRGFNKDVVRLMDLRTTGMEFASEMVVKASLHGVKVAEVPTTLSPDGRDRPPHLRSWRDGWRHLRFLLFFSPKWLFFIPGLCLSLFGLVIVGALMFGPVTLFGVTFSNNTMIYGTAMILVGVQSMFFFLLAKAFTVFTKLAPKPAWFDKFYNAWTFEAPLLIGVVLILLGLGGVAFTLLVWKSVLFGPLDPVWSVRLASLSALCLSLGASLIFNSFFFGLISTGRR